MTASSSTVTLARKIFRRLREKAGLVSGFSDIEMHLWMLRDDARAEAFERALTKAIRPGDVVVDVGAGTCLLSMMACRAGAARVYAIEETGIIDLARTLVQQNGYGDRIVLLRGNSGRIRLPESADVVVSETIGSFVFSEAILETMEDARRRFLKPGGILIPGQISIRVAPVESWQEGIGFLERPVRGFDYRAAAELFDSEMVVAAKAIGKGHLLDDARPLYEIDFSAGAGITNFDRTLEFTARRDGVLHGFVGTWRARLHDDVDLICEPGGPPVHWPPLLFPLPGGIPVRAGDRIVLSFARKDRPGWHWKWSVRIRPRGSSS